METWIVGIASACLGAIVGGLIDLLAVDVGRATP
jgi:hypothetical protein